MTTQGDVALLNDPVAQELLHSRHVAHLAYVCPDGTPRSTPIWFHWNGSEIVLGTPPDAPKIDMIEQNPNVAVTIDDPNFPYKVLFVRGTAAVNVVDGVAPEYAAAAERYFGEEGGKAWVAQVTPLAPQMARVVVTPQWVAILDFVHRFPSALEKAMAQAGGGAS